MPFFRYPKPLLPLLLVFGTPAYSQIATQIPGDAGSLSLTVWTTDADPPATVLLLPGWGGGPTDVMGLGDALSDRGIPVVVLSPRGWRDSEGDYTHAGAMRDIETVLLWIRQSPGARAFDLDADRVVLGGHSWGGGFSMAYAAGDSSVREVFSIGGTDHGVLGRQMDADPAYAAMVHRILSSTVAPDGPIRFEVGPGLREFAERPDTYGLRENAGRLADRSILLIGGWEDVNVTIEDMMLPVYRALRSAGADDVTFLTYHANHGFGPPVRTDMQRAIGDWIRSR